MRRRIVAMLLLVALACLARRLDPQARSAG
jgi:hypothetical protein